MEIFCWRCLHLLVKNTKQWTNNRLLFPSVCLSQSALCVRTSVCVCVCERVSFSRKASKYMRSALGLCLALARLGQTHSKFPEGEHREKRFHADKSLAQIKRQISGKDKRCWLAENNGDAETQVPEEPACRAPRCAWIKPANQGFLTRSYTLCSCETEMCLLIVVFLCARPLKLLRVRSFTDSLGWFKRWTCIEKATGEIIYLI